MTVDAPSVAFLLDEGYAWVEWLSSSSASCIDIRKKDRNRRKTHITTLRAKEMSNMPLGATSDDDLALNGRLTALTPRTKELMEVQMAIESQRVVVVIVHAMAVRGFDLLARQTRLDTLQPRFARLRRLGVEGDALETFAAVVA